MVEEWRKRWRQIGKEGGRKAREKRGRWKKMKGEVKTE